MQHNAPPLRKKVALLYFFCIFANYNGILWLEKIKNY